MTSKKAICTVLMLAILFLPGCSSSSPTQVALGTTAALATTALLMGSTPPLVQAVFLQTLVVALVGVLVLHTFLSVPPKIPNLAWTEITHFGLVTAFITVALLITLFGSSQVQQTGGGPVFPAGQGPDGFTVAANTPLQLAEGDFHIVHFTCADVIPVTSADPTVVYQYAFVFDSDGNTTNNYTTADNDFFNDTDKWYVMSYTDAGGWVLTVSTAFDGTIVEVASAARVIIKDNAMTLLVPAGEFAVSDPNYRVTAFCHNGDFGIPEPHNWSGDLHPPVADGLETFPAQN
ncbi:MAG: hypothetical protein ACYTG3_18730 [Planctomycetota bacterium]|jgi:hypothetical protein